MVGALTWRGAGGRVPGHRSGGGGTRGGEQRGTAARLIALAQLGETVRQVLQRDLQRLVLGPPVVERPLESEVLLGHHLAEPAHLLERLVELALQVAHLTLQVQHLQVETFDVLVCGRRR